MHLNLKIARLNWQESGDNYQFREKFEIFDRNLSGWDIVNIDIFHQVEVASDQLSHYVNWEYSILIFIFIVKTWYKKSIKRACKMTNRFIYNFQPIYGETLTKGEGRWSSLFLISSQLFATNKPSLPRPTSQPPFVVHRPES